MLLSALALPAVGAASASGTPADLFVDNRPGMYCSDTGTGEQSKPYCTITKAAAAVQPGQRVIIGPGRYPEAVNITRSGRADAPISFLGQGVSVTDNDKTVIGGTGTKTTERALSVTGAQHVLIKGIDFFASQEGVHVENSSDITVLRGTVTGAQSAAVRVTGSSARVTLGKLDLTSTIGSGIAVDGGASATVVSTNRIKAGTGAAVSVTDAPGTVVVANSVQALCTAGIELAGASPGAVVENNVISPVEAYGTLPGSCAEERPAAVRVSAPSVTGSKVDYNVLDTANGLAAYAWSGTKYSDRAAFTAATGQGVHDAFANPHIPQRGDRHAAALPTVDSADENAPGLLAPEPYEPGFEDDPLTPNSGTGTGIRDRGAQEYRNVGTAFTPLGPTRVLDTRLGIGAPANEQVNSYLELQVTGRAGVPATGVTAVVLNVTVPQTWDSGYLSVYPLYGWSGTSNLNWLAGETVSNQVTVPVAANGTVGFVPHTPYGVHLIADLAGYYGVSGSGFTPTAPARALDTRTGTGATQAPVGPGGTVDLQVAGVNGLPAAGITAVTMNVTVTDGTGTGFLTVYPHGRPRPGTSVLNWTAGRTLATLVTVPVVDGKVSFYAGSSGTVQFVADVAGYHSDQGHQVYHSMTPVRLLDTRADTPTLCQAPPRPAAAVPAAGTLDLPVCAAAEATSVTLNTTVTETGAAGYLTVHPHGAARPLASNLNWTAGQTVPNQMVVQVLDGKLSFYNGSAQSTQLIVDLVGYHSF